MFKLCMTKLLSLQLCELIAFIVGVALLVFMPAMSRINDATPQSAFGCIELAFILQ